MALLFSAKHELFKRALEIPVEDCVDDGVERRVGVGEPPRHGNQFGTHGD